MRKLWRTAEPLGALALFMSLNFLGVTDGHASSEDPLDELGRLSLEELLQVDVEVNVASNNAEMRRETSAVVTLITRGDIERAHARDLLDVLCMVPGFTPTWDVGAASFTSRGLYGFEGRTLVLVDGMPLSELSFGTFPIAHSFPVHLIDRVEIIRGPGSVLYGGAAELSVISIVTHQPEQTTGGIAAARGAVYTSGHFGLADVGFSYGRVMGPLDLSVLGFYGGAQLSTGSYPNLGRMPKIDQSFATSGVRTAASVVRVNLYRDTEIRALAHVHDLHDLPPPGDDMSARTAAEYLQDFKTQTRFTTFGGLAQHTFRPHPTTKVVPGVRYHFSHPWQPVSEGPAAVDFSSVATHRIGPTLRTEFALADVQLTVGGEAFWDHAAVKRTEDAPDDLGLRLSPSAPPQRAIVIRHGALYADARYALLGTLQSSRRFNVYAGARYDRSQLYGHNLAPRAALTFVRDELHAKLMYSSAFRAPLLANTAFSDFGIDPKKPWRNPVGPERSWIGEVEVGYVFANTVSVVTNVYYQQVNDIIEYRYNQSEDDVYSDNGGKLATYGAEEELRMSAGLYQSVANLSLVAPRFFADTNENAYAAEPFGGDTYIAPDTNAQGQLRFPTLLAVPRWKLYTNQSLELPRKVSLQASLLVLGRRRGTSGFGTSKEIPTQAIVGLGLRYGDAAGIEDLVLDLSVQDLLSERIALAVPFYDSGRDAFRYGGRQVTLSVSYGL